ncbi:hypothetical protein CTRI78_v001457 [Colletotrichum trifolii]|uniref:Uncharacterized protein n=1 Tax=Colletotrichum trifolii TaxID=5466 RepID=A0A4R8RQM9_COLTR|nr:hypothetical protein CTRI78_v001457 [Colletotrichum trifolii]
MLSADSQPWRWIRTCLARHVYTGGPAAAGGRRPSRPVSRPVLSPPATSLSFVQTDESHAVSVRWQLCSLCTRSRNPGNESPLSLSHSHSHSLASRNLNLVRCPFAAANSRTQQRSSGAVPGMHSKRRSASQDDCREQDAQLCSAGQAQNCQGGAMLVKSKSRKFPK